MLDFSLNEVETLEGLPSYNVEITPGGRESLHFCLCPVHRHNLIKTGRSVWASLSYSWTPKVCEVCNVGFEPFLALLDTCKRGKPDARLQPRR